VGCVPVTPRRGDRWLVLSLGDVDHGLATGLAEDAIVGQRNIRVSKGSAGSKRLWTNPSKTAIFMPVFYIFFLKQMVIEN
jgi:hypothetical protein